LEKMRVAVFELDGYEGDDLIGTISTVAVSKSSVSSRGPVGRFPRPTASLASLSAGARPGSPTPATPALADSSDSLDDSDSDLEVIILTGDRDLLQLVDDRVKVLMPVVGMSKTVLFDSEMVLGKYGVLPSQFVDYKALIGDSSDGYPGVTGIGPKTASGLLQKYETFENLYKHVGELPEKTGLKLATDAEQAALAKRLATIVRDVPIQFSIEKCACADFDLTALREAFAEQGFKSLLGRLDGVLGGKGKEEKKEKKEEKKKRGDQLELL
jgi:DNA polymerase-1